MNDHRGDEDGGTFDREQPFRGAVGVRGHMGKAEIGIMMFYKIVALRWEVKSANMLNAPFRGANEYFLEHHVFDAAAQDSATHEPGVDYPFEV